MKEDLSEPVLLTKQQVEIQEKSLARFLEWIRHADSKSQVYISFNLAMIGAIVAGLPTPDKMSLKSIGLLIIGGGVPTFNLVHCLHAVAPQTSSHAKASHIFFGLLQEKDIDQYQNAIANRKESEYLRDLNDQCFANSQIAEKKYRHLKIASIWTFRCAPIWLLAIYILYKWR